MLGQKTARNVVKLNETMRAEFQCATKDKVKSTSASQIPDLINKDTLKTWFEFHVFPKGEGWNLPVNCEEGVAPDGTSWGLRLSVYFSIGADQAEIAGRTLIAFATLYRIVHQQRCIDALGITQENLNAYKEGGDWNEYWQKYEAYNRELGDNGGYGGNTFVCVKRELDRMELRLSWEGTKLPSFDDCTSEQAKKQRSYYSNRNRKLQTVVQETTENIVANQPEASTGEAVV